MTSYPFCASYFTLRYFVSEHKRHMCKAKCTLSRKPVSYIWAEAGTSYDTVSKKTW